jgi:tetratricopeptide (TPR) repeat protein
MAKKKQKKTKILPWEDLSALSKAKRTTLPDTAKSADQLHDPGISGKKLLIQICAVSVFATAVFFLSLFGKFVFMDHLLIGPFESVSAQPGFLIQNLFGSILSPFGQSWLKTTFALDISSFGHIPLWYHAVNIVIQVLTCVYFYLLVFRLARLWGPSNQRDQFPYNLALSASLLLACHPLVAESVAYISGRAGVLTACNLFLTLNLFLFGLFARTTSYRVSAYIACFFTLYMGIASSPEGLAIPIMMFLLIFLVKPATTSFSEWFDEKAGEMTVTAMLSIALPFLARLPFSNIFNNNLYMPPLSYSLYLASQFKGLLLYYARTAIFPIGLSVEPSPFVAQSWYDPGTVCGIIFLGALIYLTYLMKDKKFIAFSLALIIVGFLPSLLVVRDEYGADRRIYVSIAGVAILVGYWLAKVWQEKKTLALTTGAALILVLTGLIVWREVTLLSDKRLWLGTIATNADSTRARTMLTLTEMNASQPVRFEKDVLNLLKDDPTCQPAYLLSGQIALDRNDWQMAKKQFSKALSLAETQQLSAYPKYQAKLGLTEALIGLKDYAAANKLCYELIGFDRKSPKANLLMGKTLIALKQPAYALSYLDIAYEQDRSFKYLEPMDRACLDTGTARYVRAAYHSSKLTSQVTPSFGMSLIFAQSALELGHADQCAAEMEKVLKNPSKYVLTPADKAKVLYLYSLAETALGKTVRGDELKKQALKTDAKVADDLRITMIDEAPEKIPEKGASHKDRR